MVSSIILYNLAQDYISSYFSVPYILSAIKPQLTLTILSPSSTTLRETIVDTTLIHGRYYMVCDSRL
jgi:hypothetical protein